MCSWAIGIHLELCASGGSELIIFRVTLESCEFSTDEESVPTRQGLGLPVSTSSLASFFKRTFASLSSELLLSFKGQLDLT